MYGYCLDDPVNLVDPLGLVGMQDVVDRFASLNRRPNILNGLKPFLFDNYKLLRPDPAFDSPLFATAEQAALNALHEYHDRDLPFEVAGNIYRTREGQFFYDAYPGNETEVGVPLRGHRYSRVSAYHTHADGDNLSLRDRMAAVDSGLTSYMINPIGSIHKYNPNSNEASIFTDQRNRDGFTSIGTWNDYSRSIKRITPEQPKGRGRFKE